MSRGKWKGLEDLDMSKSPDIVENNAINGEGSRHISKTEGTFNLDMSIFDIIKESTPLEEKEISFWREK